MLAIMSIELIVVAIIFILLIGFCVVRVALFIKKTNRIKLGMSRDEVLANAGSPKRKVTLKESRAYLYYIGAISFYRWICVVVIFKNDKVTSIERDVGFHIFSKLPYPFEKY